MAELLYNVKDVFTKYLQNKKYNIPEYQRGYKWSEQQVEQLLNDIEKFSKTREEDHFYCLQNITLFDNLSNKNLINVVDGQQRLTTITLLLSYLEEYSLLEDKLLYAVREPSNNFLQSIVKNENSIIQKITSSKDFESFLNKNEANDYQDIYYMFTALKTIDDWFQNKDTFHFKEVLLNHVKLIVNKVASVSEQELFMNLNAGKVHLDGSDLVRAILITRVAKQEIEDFDPNNVQHIVTLNQRRTRIGWELDELNAWWSKKDVKKYYKNFTSIQTGKKETIKFNQDIYSINLLFKIWADKNGETEIILHLFEKDNAQQIYNSILNTHRVLKDWYGDREIYHYLGFLFNQLQMNVSKVFESWENENKKRSDFINKWCKNQIETRLLGIHNKNESEESGLCYWLKQIKNFDSDEPTNWYFEPKLEKVLILLDIIDHSEEKETGVTLPFLKPEFFRNAEEDKEHIFSSTPKEFKEIKDLKKPINHFNKYINSLNVGYDKNDYIPDFSETETEWGELTDEEKNTILQTFKLNIHKKRPINSIGNLVLLHQTINRGFGNNTYDKKRVTVIENTKNGKYVRNHTSNVFLKSITTDDLNNWTFKDIKDNAVSIKLKLESFFNTKCDD